VDNTTYGPCSGKCQSGVTTYYTPTAKFVYDGDGVRVLQVAINGTQVITTAYAGALEVQITGTQRITKTYYSAGSQLIAMRQFTTPTSSVLYFLHSDHLGSTSLTTDANGNAVARQLYDAWGNVRYVNGTLPTDIGYTGKRFDTTGLVYLGARYYSPAVGRFVSADTIVPDPKQSRDFNRYAYGGNNPITLIDINGHQTPPQCSSYGICSTGTGGPYVQATPAVQPLTVGTTNSKNDSYVYPDNGVLLQYNWPTQVSGRWEDAVASPAAAVTTLAPIKANAEMREVRLYDMVNHIQTDEFTEFGGALGGGIPGTKFGIAAEGVFSPQKGFSGDLALQGGVSGFQGSLQFGDHQVIAMLKFGEIKTDSFGLQADIGRTKYYLTTRAFIENMGLDSIGRQYATGGTLEGGYEEHGYWDHGRWVSGFDFLRFTRLPAIKPDWDIPYEVIPK
jgi:RHS repeat-associated protein